MAGKHIQYELLTGVEAGEWTDDDCWTAGSVYGLCEARLGEMARLMRQAAKGTPKPDENEDNNGVSGDVEDEIDSDQAHRK